MYQKPTIGIIVTGNELVQPGLPLTYGKIYESNSIMLQTALQDAFYENVKTYEVNDDFENTKNILAQALTENQVVLVSGGISVGDYDFVPKAAAAAGVEAIFHKIKQKPLQFRNLRSIPHIYLNLSGMLLHISHISYYFYTVFK